jgi:hypothetical protein
MAKQIQLKWANQITRNGDSANHLKRERKDKDDGTEEKPTKKIALDSMSFIELQFLFSGLIMRRSG